MGGVAVTTSARRVLISVIVPTRDRDQLLRSALLSINANRGAGIDLDIVVVDNGSGEETAEIAVQAGARYVRSPRSGASAARNFGMELATGDYITFLDDDDVWTAGHLASLVGWLEDRPDFGAVLGQVCNVDHDLGGSGPAWPEALPADGLVFRSLLRIQPQVGATLVRKQVAGAVGPFDEALLSDEDWDWHLRLSILARVGFVPVIAVLFRARPEGTDDELQWVRFPYVREVFWRNVRRGGMRWPYLPGLAGTYLHHLGMWHGLFIRSAKAHARHGSLVRARQSLGRAARVSPIHFAWSVVHDSGTRQTVAAALRAGGTAAAESKGVAPASARTR